MSEGSCTTSSMLTAKRLATWANGCQKHATTASRPATWGPTASMAAAASSEPS